MTLLYLDYGANAYREDGTSVLHLAVDSFDPSFCEQLITKYQVNVNAVGYQQKTALIRLTAITEAVPPREMVEMLLSHGADKTLTDANGKTAYDYAVENGYTELAELLYRIGGTAETVKKPPSDELQLSGGVVEDYRLIYLYDESGAPIGMQHRTPSMAQGVFYTYWFEKNLQGKKKVVEVLAKF